MAFPTLSRNPLSVKATYRDNKISGISEDNYVSRRPRVTKEARQWEVTYDLLKTADRDLLVTHYESVGMHTSFSWTDNESVSHTVYYNKPLSFTRVVPGWFKVETLEMTEV